MAIALLTGHFFFGISAPVFMIFIYRMIGFLRLMKPFARSWAQAYNPFKNGRTNMILEVSFNIALGSE